MSTLHVHGRAALVEQELEAAVVAAGAVVLGTGHLTARQLIEAAWAAQRRPVRLGPAGEALLVEAVAVESGIGAGRRGGRDCPPGVASALWAIFVEWRRGGLTPAQVASAARRAGPSSGRLVELAGAYGRYVERLGDRADEAGVQRAALEAIAEGRPVSALSNVSRVVVHGAALDPLLVEVALALARRGLPVEVQLPLVAEPGAARPLLERALEPAARRIEDRAELPIEPHFLPPGRAKGESDPLARFAAQLFRPIADRRRAAVPDAPVEVVRAASPDAEARFVARWVRDRLSAGAAPGRIAVVSRDAATRERALAWLQRYGVPTSARPGLPLLASVPLRLALGLSALVDEGVPREELIALLTSRFVDGWIPAEGDEPAIPPHRIARALREAGVRDANLEGQGQAEAGQSGYRARLLDLARAVPAEDPRRRRLIERIERRVSGWLALLGRLPEEATVPEHGRALAAAVDALGLRERARGYRVGEEAGLEDTDRVALDEQAVRALDRLLLDLPRAARRAGLSSTPISRRRFDRLVEDLLGREAVRAGGARGGLVEVASPEAVIGRRFDHVVACGLVDGTFPARAPESPLLGDEDRRRFNALVGRDVMELSSVRTDREALIFLELCGAAAGSLLLAHAAADTSGGPQLPSIFVDEAERARGARATSVPLAPVPRVADCRTPRELRARLLLERDAPRAPGQAGRDPEATRALLVEAARGDEEAVTTTATAARIERERLAFFDGRRPPGRYDGFIADGAVREALAARLPGTPERPLSASAIEDYARCGFRFFARRVLRLEAPEETGDDLDPMTAGRLHHAVLEHLYRRLSGEGALPLRGRASEQLAVDESVEAVLGAWARSERQGHPSLFAARARRVRADVRMLVVREARDAFFAPRVPRHFELPFTVEIPAPQPGAPPLHLRGTIDRIDVDGDSALVVDYKSGRSTTLRARIAAPAQLSTSFQLPVYAAAARATLGLRRVDAVFLGLRDATPTPVLEDDARFVLSPASGRDGAEGRTVGSAVRDLYDRMRAGAFTAEPTDCDRCELGAACRVVIRPRAVDEGR